MVSLRRAVWVALVVTAWAAVVRVDLISGTVAQPARNSGTGKRVALVVGNGRYSSSPLRNLENDATDGTAKLRILEFTVNELTNVTKQQFIPAISQFGREIVGADLALFYHSGHGMQFRGENYFLPVDIPLDADTEIEFSGVHIDRALREMEIAQARVTVIILDGCRSNPFRAASRSANPGLAMVTASAGTYIAFATAPGKEARDGAGKNGMFTKHLLAFIDEPGMKLEDFKQIRSAIVAETHDAQVPWDSSSLIIEHPDYDTDEAVITVAPGGTKLLEIALTSVMGSLAVESDPPGAALRLDGMMLSQTTPHTVAQLRRGKHLIEWTLDGHDPVRQEVDVASGRTVTARLELDPRFGLLSVASDPPVAEIAASGKVLGRTPLSSIRLEPGSHRLTLARDGYHSAEVTADTRTTSRLHVTWSPRASSACLLPGTVEVK